MFRPIAALAALAALLCACAALAQAPGADAAQQPPPKSLEEILGCLAAGLPRDWRSATIEVIDIGEGGGKERTFEARYSFTRAKDAKPQRLRPCDETDPARNVYRLNEFLEPGKRHWKRAILTFRAEGKFELKYDYAE